MTGHGDPSNIGTAGSRTLATQFITAEFRGKGAHAAFSPWDGINTLDAAVAVYNNMSMLRQQIKPDERLHGCFLDVPKVSNIIPDYTKMQCVVRSPTLEGCVKLREKIKDCIHAGELATGCKAKISEDPIHADTLINETLCERYQTHMHEYGVHVRKLGDRLLPVATDQGIIFPVYCFFL
jgi:metal-dependent amidase/aminoacylase/carboxypeptidase family protein